MSQLKLVALDEEDLAVVSAHVQDAVAKVSDFAFIATERRFVVAMNRFAWEQKRGLFGRKGERRRSVLHFEGVSAAKSTGFRLDDKDAVLSILALRFELANAPSGMIEITCAGGAAIRLDVDYVEARLADLGAAWETFALPRHKI